MIIFLCGLLGIMSIHTTVSWVKSTSKKHGIRRLSMVQATTMQEDWKYEYITSGNNLRLEKFGPISVFRPCPSANYPCSMLSSRIAQEASLLYNKIDSTKGEWVMQNGVSLENWKVQFDHMVFKLHSYEMGQVGIFPEQQTNWKWISKKILSAASQTNRISKPIRVLNAFAYTGGSTLASLVAPNVQVVHLDASKTFIQAAKENHALSLTAQGTIRWMIDDCLTFLDREIKRSNENPALKYDAMIFDPPAFGRFESKTWKLDRDLPLLLEKLSCLLSDDPIFILLSCHDEQWPVERLERVFTHTVLSTNKRLVGGKVEANQLWLHPTQQPTTTTGKDNVVKGNSLQLGQCVRWSAIR